MVLQSHDVFLGVFLDGKMKIPRCVIVEELSPGSLLDYFYNFFSVNAIYWHILLPRLERTLKNTQKALLITFCKQS